MSQTGTSFELIDAYPPVLHASAAQEFLRAVKSDGMHGRMTRVMTARRSELCDAVRLAAGRLETAARKTDMSAVYGEAHEIRGLAQSGGLTASGRIANGLCLYLDAVDRAKLPADTGIVGLHVGAILRAAYAEDEATRLGSEVAEELAGLVARRLGKAAPQSIR